MIQLQTISLGSEHGGLIGGTKPEDVWVLDVMEYVPSKSTQHGRMLNLGIIKGVHFLFLQHEVLLRGWCCSP